MRRWTVIRKMLISILLLLTGTTFAHKFYVSMTTLDVNIATNSLEITHRLFSHDLEKALSLWQGRIIDLEDEGVEELVKEYLQDRFVMPCGVNNSPLQWVGMELDYQFLWIYQECKSFTSLQHMPVKNSMMMEAFPKQLNILNYRSGAKQGALVFEDEKIKNLDIL